MGVGVGVVAEFGGSRSDMCFPFALMWYDVPACSVRRNTDTVDRAIFGTFRKETRGMWVYLMRMVFKICHVRVLIKQTKCHWKILAGLATILQVQRCDFLPTDRHIPTAWMWVSLLVCVGVFGQSAFGIV